MSWAYARVHLHSGVVYNVQETLDQIADKISALLRVDDFIEVKEGRPPETIRIRVRANEIAAVEEIIS